MHPRIRHLMLCASALAGLAGVPRVLAQAVTADASKKTTDTHDTTKADETIELSPFTVSTSKDKGYRATNSISGTRLNSAGLGI